jgi:hypothetical protein
VPIVASKSMRIEAKMAPPSPAERQAILTDIGQRLDHLPIGPMHRKVVVAIGLGLFFEVYEILLSSTIATALKTSRRLSSQIRKSPNSPGRFRCGARSSGMARVRSGGAVRATSNSPVTAKRSAGSWVRPGPLSAQRRGPASLSHKASVNQAAMPSRPRVNVDAVLGHVVE